MNLNASPPGLLNPQKMPRVPGLSVPAQFYLVTRTPAPLAGMRYPTTGAPWQAFYKLGLRHVISLHSDPTRPYNPAPLAILSAVQLEDLYNGALPSNLQWEEDLVGVVMKVAKEALQAEEGVLVHCAGGIGRTGTLIGCLLSSLGCPPQTAIHYLDRLNRARGHQGWPESPWQAEMVRKYSTGL